MKKLVKPVELVLLWFFGTVFVQIMVGICLGIVGGALGLSDEAFNSSSMTFSFYLVVSLVELAALLAYARWRKLTLADFGLADGVPWRRLWWVLPAFGIYMLIAVLLSAGIDAIFPGFNLDQVQDLGFETRQTLAGYAFVFIALVVLPPLVEEGIFRGLLFGGFRKYWSFWPAALISSALFGLAHMQWNIAVDTAVLGLVSCYLLEKTHSLWPSIALHATKNLIAFILLFVLQIS